MLLKLEKYPITWREEKIGNIIIPKNINPTEGRLYIDAEGKTWILFILEREVETYISRYYIVSTEADADLSRYYTVFACSVEEPTQAEKITNRLACVYLK